MSSVTFNIHRPYGGSQVGSCSGTLLNRLSGQRIGGSPPPMYYTHILITAASVDIRDGCTRISSTSQMAFGMGDELRNGSNKFIVVFVMRIDNQKIVYLTRDAVDWTGAGPI